jgi:hypothetical protein
MAKCPPYCPPTCHFEINYCDYPVYCDDYDCDYPETCRTLISSDCVVYYGTILQQYGVQNGDTVTNIILQLVELLYPGCIPTTTTTSTSTTSTTTTTTATPCECYTVTATEFCTATWTNCDGTPGEHTDFGKEPTIIICAQQDSISITGLAPLCTADIASSGLCTTLGDCPTTTTTTVPQSYCTQVDVTGTVTISYINYNGVKIFVTLTDESISICAWDNSVIVESGTGSIVVTTEIIPCTSNEDCIGSTTTTTTIPVI